MKRFFNICNTTYESTKTLHKYVFLYNQNASEIDITLAIQALKFH